MEKMLALGTEEALSCARLSPEGDHHDDSVNGNPSDDDGRKRKTNLYVSICSGGPWLDW